MRILVTGCAGMIGSHLCDALLAKGHEVIGVDNLAIGTNKNMEVALKSKKFKFVKASVLDRKKMNALAKNADAVAHLAAWKIPIGEMKAEDTLILNSRGTEVMIGATIKAKAKFVFASTSDVYGKSDAVPFREDGNLVLGPSTVQRWSYAASKIFDEHLCFAMQKSQGLKMVILRYFNTYGPRQDISYVSGTPQGLFIVAIMNGKPITIHGTGNQTRSFTYISDSVDCTVRAIENRKAVGEIINVGNDKTEMTIKDLAFAVKKIVEPCAKKKCRIEFISFEKAFGNYEDVLKRVPDISKAKKLLGYLPKVGNIEGIKKTFEWQRQFYR